MDEINGVKGTIKLTNTYKVLTNENDNDIEPMEINNTHKSIKIVKKVRRGNRKKFHMTRQYSDCVKMFSTNGAGITKGKQNSLRNEVMNTKSNVVTAQETHSTEKGKIKITNFITFEAIRKKKGGGTIIAVHEDLSPKLIEEYSEEFELLVVEIKTKQKDIRVISGYGPQETWVEESRMPFFLALDVEIEKAQLAGKSVILEIDANSKLGPKYIPDDPHEMSPNGAILAEVFEKHNMVVANGSKKSTGTITRKRVTKTNIEESVIDIVAFSDDLKEHFVAFHVDEERKHVLTRIKNTKRGQKKKESDHNVLQTEFNCEVSDKKNTKIESYNLKNKDCQAKFKAYTSQENILSGVFNNNDDPETVTEVLIKKINGCIATNFKKRRVNNKVELKSKDLYDKMRDLKGKTDDKSKEELEKVVKAIADESETHAKIVREELDKMDSNEGGLNPNKLWKLKKKLCPKAMDPPTAMLDKEGNLLTNDEAIKERAIEVYTTRLAANKIEPHLEKLEEARNELCHLRLKLAKLDKTKPWDMDDLKAAVKQLANDKSRDAENHANELFKETVAGTDLLKAVLNLMNLIKEKQKYPTIMEKCNLTSLHKRGSKKDFSNYRGIFRVSILRSILDRLLYNSSYETIDSNLTDGNVGARKRRGCRDNMFVMSAITNSVVKGKCPPIQVQVTDVETCFDKLWLENCINALFENNLKNDMLNLLYLENRNAQIAVKVNNQLSRRTNVTNVEIQGSIWSSLKCTSVMDTLNKHVMNQESLQYFYKQDKHIPIGIRGMVDDTLGISQCGNTSIELNSVINSFIETQRLTLSEKKSVVVHIGNKQKCKQKCPKLKVHSALMAESESTKYLGNFISSQGGVSDTVEDRRKKGWGKVAQVMAILESVNFGSHKVEVGLLLRRAILVNSLLFTAETWSGVTERDLVRLEQVDQALLDKLVNGHSKSAREFAYLETGAIKLRHILTINRLMFHYNLLQTDKKETTRKIYEKQKEQTTKGDWFEYLLKDFKFIQEEMDEDKIRKMDKQTYKNHIKEKVKKAAFDHFLKEKEKHTKLNEVNYTELKIQKYLTSNKFSNEERNLLYSLRSRCHDSKNNFRKMNKHNLRCIFGCTSLEDQRHTFIICQKIRCQLNLKDTRYENIFSDIDKQKEAIEIFLRINDKRKEEKDKLPPGGV